jgi:SAM-dependent methyltransferase
VIHLDNHHRVSRCPLCGSAAVENVGAIEYGPEPHFSSHAVALSAVPELWRCRACRSGFTQNALPDELTARLYAEGDSGTRWSATTFLDKYTSEVAAALRPLFVPDARVVDIGANTGELLDFARTLGCRTSAIEYSAASRVALEGKGHAAFASMDAAGDGYQVVIAFDLIEHLLDVPAFLERCRRLLRPAGTIAILTGDIGCPSARFAGAAWWYCSYPEHVRFPSRRFFEQVPGFRLERVVPTYASRGYVSGWVRRGAGLLYGVVRRRYGGLPALGPDHQLVILHKT